MTEAAHEAGVQASAATANLGPLIEDIQEVRLAVVLYGGVSLAIYMNGVAQELLRLVRATAPIGLEGDERTHGLNERDLRGSEKVYRKLGQMAARDGRSPSVTKPLDDVLRRFVIDIISGSSAGGINGVFLAKAIANHQTIDALQKLWVEEGDIAKLINDRGSLEGLKQRIGPKGPPASLLNSRRMYRKLLEAFDGMDGDVDATRSTAMTVSPYADQLDLYVTATDLQGLRLPIQIANGVVVEDRHRNVFHFRYASEDVGGQQVNEFKADNNPFLAFAARCTSAFPFAFEPMVLTTIDDDLADFPRYPPARYGADAPEWQRFYRDYLELPEDLSIGGDAKTPGQAASVDVTASMAFKDRQFGDGGSLDNKPFTWTTAELLRRRADNPVDRKLLFVEPDPSIPAEVRKLLDPLQNVLAQAVFLPRQETIRADLQEVMARNEVIRRIDSVLLDVETKLSPARRVDFTSMTIDQEAAEYGPNYGAYRTLRVSTVTDDLAALIGSALGYPNSPGYALAIRYLLEAWRRDRFPDVADPDGTVPPGTTLTSFLSVYDMQYRFRRLDLVSRKIDHVYPLRQAASVAGPILMNAGITFWPSDEETEVAFQTELRRLKLAINVINHLWFRRVLAQLRARPSSTGTQGEFQDLVAPLYLSEAPLQEILRGADADERRRLAWDRFAANRDGFVRLGDWLGALFRSLSGGANAYWASQLAPPAAPTGVPEVAAQTLVRLTYERFEAYDSVAFPMAYGSQVGESDEVEIIRISPIDARRLRDLEKHDALPKVAGASFGHFGGFLDEMWRKNDILWGRLDAAELLVETLAPQRGGDGSEVVEPLRKEAQAAIIREHFDDEEKAAIVRRLMDELAAAGSPRPKSAGEASRAAAAYGADRRLQAVIEQLIGDDEQLVEAFGRDYTVDLHLDPARMTKVGGRALHVTGDVVRNAADQRGTRALKKPAFWVGRIGQLITGLAEASIPGSWTHLLVFHWLALFYLFEVATFVVGLVFGLPVLQRWALSAVLITFSANVVLWTLHAFLTERRWLRAVLAICVVLVIVAIGVLAWLELVHLGQDHPAIPFFGR